MLKVVLASALTLTPALALASTTSKPYDYQGMSNWSQQPTPNTPIRRHHYRHHLHVAKHTTAPHQEPRDDSSIVRLRGELESLRKEIAQIRTEVGRPSWEGVSIPFLSKVVPNAITASLPNLRLLVQPPAPSTPMPATSSGLLEAVDEARAYLLSTATPGYTMSRQGPKIAIDRLHPGFAIKLAAAVKLARSEGLDRAGLYSAYRPPAFGVGGFRDKFNSLHSYGLAVDMTGIGSAASKAAHLWQNIVKTVGLFLPYGPNNRAEFNHTQMVATKVASSGLRKTISASAPKDLNKMWAASGVKVPSEPVSASVKLLPGVDFVSDTTPTETSVAQLMRTRRHALWAKW